MIKRTDQSRGCLKEVRCSENPRTENYKPANALQATFDTTRKIARRREVSGSNTGESIGF